MSCPVAADTTSPVPFIFYITLRRVAVFKEHQARGDSITHAYTLECNYNMGTKNAQKYTPQDFRVLGRALLTALLELTSDCPPPGVAAAAADPPKAPIEAALEADGESKYAEGGEGKSTDDDEDKQTNDDEDKYGDGGASAEQEEAKGDMGDAEVSMAQCPCLPMLEAKPDMAIHRGLDALGSSRKIKEKIVGGARGKKGAKGGTKKKLSLAKASLKERMAAKQDQQKKPPPPVESELAVTQRAESRQAAAEADAGDGLSSSLTSVALFVLEDAVEALQAQLDDGAELSEAKKYALKKQLAVKKAAKLREEKRLKQKRAQEEMQKGTGGVSESKQQAGEEKAVLGEATNTSSSSGEV
jgi:hypothetical protein